VFDPGLGFDPGRLFVSRYGFNFRATRKNKQREKNPAPGAGLIAGGSRESRQTGLKRRQNGGIWG
jgi:hypothetical protein